MPVSKPTAKFSSAGTLQSPKFHLAQRIPLNNTEFLQKWGKRSKNEPLLQNPTVQGLAQGVANNSSISLSLCGHPAPGWLQGRPPGPSCDQEGHTRTAAAQGCSQPVLQEPEHLRSRALCHRVSVITKGKGRKGGVGSRWTRTSSRLSKVFTVLGHQFGA